MYNVSLLGIGTMKVHWDIVQRGLYNEYMLTKMEKKEKAEAFIISL
jgi:hypothetical protein